MRVWPLALLMLPGCGVSVTTWTWAYDTGAEAAEADADTDADSDTDTDSDTDADTDADTDVDPPTGLLRVLHLVPDADRLDAWLDGGAEAIAVDLKFPESSGNLLVEEGEQEVLWVERADGVDDALKSTSVEVDAEQYRTVVLFGAEASLQGMVLEDDNRSISNADQRIRFAHLGQEAPTVNIIDLDEDEMLLEDLAYGSLEVEDVSRKFDRMGLDWNGDGTSDATYQLPASTPGGRMDVLISHNKGGTPIFVFVQEDDGGAERIDGF